MQEKQFLKEGKPPWNILSRLLSYLPTKDPDLIVGPNIGEDAAIIRFKDGFLVIHSDPITAATKRIGWLSIHVAANDIAVRGARPRWFLPVVLLPPSTSINDAEKIFAEMGEAAKSLNGVIVGGHTEITPGLPRPIISMTAIGYSTNRVVLTRNAKPGDKILAIGRVGGEGVGVIAWDFEEKLLSLGISKDIITEAKKYAYEISVVNTALSIKYYANSMHDPTEGGLLQGLREIALASKTLIIVYRDNIRIDHIVEEITKKLGLDPLRILSSGLLIATVPEKYLDEATQVLEDKGYKYSIIGEIKQADPYGRVIVKSNIEMYEVKKDIIDEIYKLWK
ncbi:MAG: AIR synthase family protein [Staphylothermus sp.]|nr:AIR synthase family protein [Staphylothermus sp.]